MHKLINLASWFSRSQLYFLWINGDSLLRNIILCSANSFVTLRDYVLRSKVLPFSEAYFIINFYRIFFVWLRKWEKWFVPWIWQRDGSCSANLRAAFFPRKPYISTWAPNLAIFSDFLGFKETRFWWRERKRTFRLILILFWRAEFQEIWRKTSRKPPTPDSQSRSANQRNAHTA